MKPTLPGLPTFSALMLSAMLAAWLGVSGPISHDFLYRWQTLIGAMIAVAGLVVASWNVNRQMQLAARAREEDRIERDLPGIRSANALVGQFRWHLDNRVGPEMIIGALYDQGLITDDDTSIKNNLQKLIPDLPDQTRRDWTGLLFDLFQSANNFQHFRVMVNMPPVVGEADGYRQTNYDNAEAQYFFACDSVLKFYDGQVRRIVADRVRLHDLRRHQERLLR
jgi:hypothetical protein